MLYHLFCTGPHPCCTASCFLSSDDVKTRSCVKTLTVKKPCTSELLLLPDMLFLLFQRAFCSNMFAVCRLCLMYTCCLYYFRELSAVTSLLSAGYV
jgi:hypothetical protein